MTTSASTKSSKVAGRKAGEGSKTGMSESTTSTSTKSSKLSNTTGTAFHIAAKAVVQTQTKTDLELTLSRQHPVANVELTTDRPRSADTKAKIVDCAVQVAVKTANKSVNTNQDLAYFRNDKQTQVTDSRRLSVEEEAKVERDGKERGWFTPGTLTNTLKPNRILTYFTQKIILAKLNAVHYARSNGIGAMLLAETYAKEATEQEKELSEEFSSGCKRFYSNDGNGRLYHTEQDEVTEVTTEKELEDRLSSCITYTEDFVREFGVERDLNFQ